MAAGDRIIVTTAEFDAAISAYKSSHTQKMDAIAALKSAVDGLAGVYDGDAGKRYQERFQELYKNLMDTDRVMQGVVSELEQIRSLAESHEQTVTGNVNALDVGNPYA